ncbi:hypothetical protein GCM10027057_29170 [Marisediminicola antarctica]|uniref:DUF2993 domain-containing protein n=1 Tax=Marisediminicola antarctica TaxID=674079 RepID=A0A7L5AMX2_9MICO|nr:hypothetical protein BHD05_08290 [Marisediminicola antarctica]
MPSDDSPSMGDTVPVSPIGTESSSAPTATRRRPLLAAVIVGVVLVLIAVLLVIADNVARSVVRDAIASELGTALPIERGSDVAVEIGGSSMLAQIAVGRLERIEVTADAVDFGKISGAADAVLTGVPLDRSQPADSVTIDFSVPEDQLVNLADNLSGIPLDTISIDGDEILLETDVRVFGIPIPISVGIAPGAADGQLTFDPNSLSVGQATVTADRMRRMLGPVAGAVLETRSFCIAEFLPEAFTLESADIRRNELVVRLAADTVILSDEALEQVGACPA